MRSRLPLGAVCAALLLAGCAGAGDGAHRRYGELALSPCAIGQSGLRVEAMCGTFEVPENRDDADGRRIALNIAVLPARNDTGLPPVFFLAGGPGQAATELADHVDTILREVRRSRDIVLVDQRGTGRSNPLDCRAADGSPLPLDPQRIADAAALTDYARACAATIGERADPRFYTSRDAVADLDAVREALGAEQVELVGGSYGTRMAQQYAMRHPQRVRTAVLAGVVPNDLVIGAEFAHTFENALALQSAQCDRTPGCRERFPTPAPEQLRRVMARLQDAPAEVEYRGASSGAIERGTVVPDTVTSLAFAFSYAPQTASLLPLILDEADQGRYGALMALTRMTGERMADDINRGMQWSVLCAEDAPRYAPAAEAADTVLGAEVGEMFFAPCAAWPHDRADPAQAEPFAAELPVLLLSGELDPVTPPAYGERVVAHLPAGRHLVLKGQGHGTLALGCVPKLLARFIETADAAALDTECLDAMRDVPPFTSFNGWDP